MVQASMSMTPGGVAWLIWREGVLGDGEAALAAGDATGRGASDGGGTAL